MVSRRIRPCERVCTARTDCLPSASARETFANLRPNARLILLRQLIRIFRESQLSPIRYQGVYGETNPHRRIRRRRRRSNPSIELCALNSLSKAFRNNQYPCEALTTGTSCTTLRIDLSRSQDQRRCRAECQSGKHAHFICTKGNRPWFARIQDQHRRQHCVGSSHGLFAIGDLKKAMLGKGDWRHAQSACTECPLPS